MSAGRKNNIAKKDYNTPPKYIQAVLDFWGEIDLDPCSNQFSTVPAKIKYQLPVDGLKEGWNFKRIFVNPPYGRDSQNKTSIYNWLGKGLNANKENNSELLYLIPVATNTKHFKALIFKNFTGICLLEDTRLKFWNQGKEDKKGAPMACCFCYLGYDFLGFEKIFSQYGKVFRI